MTRAAVATTYGGPEVLEVVELASTEPGPGEVTVAVRAAGVNPVDAKIRAGLFGPDPALLPRRLGLEAAGVITAVGPADPGAAVPFAVGDEVIAFRADGAYASEITVPVAALTPSPPRSPGTRRPGCCWPG